MCPARIRTVSGEKGHCSYISIAVAISLSFALARMCLVRVLDASRTQMHLTETRVNVTLELSCTVGKHIMYICPRAQISLCGYYVHTVL